jgi:GNAT superfamily N-acetyltransferase
VRHSGRRQQAGLRAVVRLAAVRGDALVGSVLAVCREDRMALLWPPSLVASGDAFEIGRALLETTFARLDRAGVLFTQCLRQPDDSAQAGLLTTARMPHVTDMVLLSRAAGCDDEGVAADLTFDVYDDTRQSRFAAILERTCEATLDCPELAGLRTGAEILGAHRQTGAFDERLWRVYRLNEVDAGILLAADHPDRNAREIVYLGVVPELRGRKIGRRMLIAALREGAESGCQTLEVAVDARNRFAMSLYRGLGFEEHCRLAVHLRLRPDQTADAR